MDPLTAGWQAAFYIAAVVVFVVAFFNPLRANPPARSNPYNLVALGLALAFFVPAWNSLALA